MAVLPAKDFEDLVVDFTLELDATDVSEPGGGGSIIVTDNTTTVDPTTELTFDPTFFDVLNPGAGEALVTYVGPGAAVPAAGIVYTDGVSFLTEAALQYDAANNQIGIQALSTGPAILVSQALGATDIHALSAGSIADDVFVTLLAGGSGFLSVEGQGLPWSMGARGSDGAFSISIDADVDTGEDRLIIDRLDNFVVGDNAVLVQGATDGFLHIPMIADDPSGTPTLFTGRAPLTIDETNDRIVFYSNGAWHFVEPGSGATVPASPGIVFTNGVTLLTDPFFQWDDGNAVLEIDGAASFGSDTVLINGGLFGVAVSDTAPALTVGISVENDSDTAASDAEFLLTVGGTSGGDPSLHLVIPATQDWSLGIDNSDADSLKISASDTLGTTDRLRILPSGITAISGTLGIDSTGGLFNTAETFTARASTGPFVASFQALENDPLASATVGIVNHAGGGDPVLTIGLTATQFYTLGVDNSASDSFKISRGGALGTTDSLILPTTGSVIAGHEATLAQNATDGFLYIPLIADDPSGTPTAVTGKSAIAVDDTNDELKFYSSGAWHTAGGGGGSIDVTDGTTTVSPADTIEFDPVYFDVTDGGGGNADVTFIRGAGAGSLITRDTYANKPSSGLLEGDYFQPIGAWFNEIYDGAAWVRESNHREIRHNVELTSGFPTWVNQSNRTFTTTTGMGVVATTSTTTASQGGGVFRSLPGANWEVDLSFFYDLRGVNFDAVQLYLRQSSDGKLILIDLQHSGSSSMDLQCEKWTNMTTFSASYAGSQNFDVLHRAGVMFSGGFMRLRVRQAGTNRQFYYSLDNGNHWTEWLTAHANNDFCTPDQWGFGCRSENPAARDSTIYVIGAYEEAL